MSEYIGDIFPVYFNIYIYIYIYIEIYVRIPELHIDATYAKSIIIINIYIYIKNKSSTQLILPSIGNKFKLSIYVCIIIY